LLEELRKPPEKLKSYNVRLLIIFGSTARGDYTEESDIDILVVADSFPSDPREAYEIVKREVTPRVEPTCFSTSRYLRKLESGSPFLIEILEDGKVVYADPEFLEKALSILKEVRKKWARRGKVWEKRDPQ